MIAEDLRAPFDPSSYSYQEMIGQVPSSIRLGTFRVHAVIGVPSASLGANNDYALRADGAAGACIYQKRAGVWVATAA